MNTRPVIDFGGLAALVKGHREGQRLRLRDAAKQCGLSPATLSRVERGEARPDLDTVQALVDWIGLSLERVVKRGATSKPQRPRKTSTVLNAAEIQFRADPDLAPQAAEALIKIMREAYRAMKKTDPER